MTREQAQPPSSREEMEQMYISHFLSMRTPSRASNAMTRHQRHDAQIVDQRV